MVLLVGLLSMSGGCSLRKMAVNSMAGTFAESGKVYARDDDPELIRGALPFALKTMETLLDEVPRNKLLLLSACSGFTQYGYAFVQQDADLIEEEDYLKSEELRDRALNLYLRGRGYGLRGLEVDHEGISGRLVRDPEAAALEFEEEDLPLVYWTGAAWGAAISIGKDRPEIVADAGVVIAMMNRCLELDEDYEDGAIHEVMISLKALPEEMGGSIPEARAHFNRALELSEGKKAGTFVTMAETVAIQTQDGKEFEQLLHRALAVDVNAVPAYRLQNILAQQRAQYLLDHEDDYILSENVIDEEGGSE